MYFVICLGPKSLSCALMLLEVTIGTAIGCVVCATFIAQSSSLLQLLLISSLTAAGYVLGSNPEWPLSCAVDSSPLGRCLRLVLPVGDLVWLSCVLNLFFSVESIGKRWVCGFICNWAIAVCMFGAYDILTPSRDHGSMFLAAVFYGLLLAGPIGIAATPPDR